MLSVAASKITGEVVHREGMHAEGYGGYAVSGSYTQGFTEVRRPITTDTVARSDTKDQKSSKLP